MKLWLGFPAAGSHVRTRCCLQIAVPSLSFSIRGLEMGSTCGSSCFSFVGMPTLNLISHIHSVLPPLSNSWIIKIVWLYIALNGTLNIDCYWGGGGGGGAVPKTSICFRAFWDAAICRRAADLSECRCPRAPSTVPPSRS